MKLLFAYDHRFIEMDDGSIFTSGPMHAGVWERYLKRFDRLDVFSRKERGQPSQGLAIAERKGVTFVDGPALSNIRSLLQTPARHRAAIDYAVAQADAVVGRLPSELGMAALAEARRQGKPTLVEVVGCAWDVYWNHGRPTAKVYAPIAFIRMRRSVARADFALYVTAQWLQRRYPTNAPAANASNVELRAFSEEARASRKARMQAIVNGRPPVLGTIASLKVRYKGIDTAIAALALLRRKGIDLQYRVLGAGDPTYYRDIAERMRVADQVHFDGVRTPGEGVGEWLDGIDLYCQPSLQEGLPRATIEAMNRGLACVGSTSGGLPELLPEDRLHRPGDERGLAEAIERLVTSPHRLADAAERDESLAEEYRPDELVGRRDAIFAKLRAAAEQASA